MRTSKEILESLPLSDGWAYRLGQHLPPDYMENLGSFIARRMREVNVLPRKDCIFRAFTLTPYDEVRVVILGMDPYYTIVKGQAMATGLAFESGIPDRIPDSLHNIIKELMDDIQGEGEYKNVDLSSWAKQGVLLVNTALTVEESNPGSHTKHWEPFTQAVLKALSEQTGIIYCLWGRHAKAYKKFINPNSNYILEAAHPSPLSAYRGWFGSKHFSEINKILHGQTKDKIEWLQKFLT